MRLKQYTFICWVAAIVAVTGCSKSYLDRFPETSISKEYFFNTEEDLNLFIQDLYNFSTDGYIGDAGTDNGTITSNTEVRTMMITSPNSTTITGGWNWSQLRKVNYFLENFKKAKISDERLKHYEGLARYFRARFYIEKVKRYSDVPWISEVITTSNEKLLFAGRDKRDMVVGKIQEDLDFAISNVDEKSKTGAVNRWIIKAEYARFALYEGTFRKYHSELNLQNTANNFLAKAASLSQDIMDKGGYSIYSTGKPNEDYYNLFVTQKLETNPEIIFARYYEYNVVNASDWPGMFGNYEYSPLRDLVQAYLMKDGSYYSSQPDYQTNGFVSEFQNRDPRLSQSYAYPGWVLNYTSTYSQGGGVYIQQLAKNFSGYHQIKGFYNYKDQATRYNMDVPLIRFAEILLIYAEAKAELGTITQDDLNKSINKLRDRVAMPRLMLDVPLDPWAAAKYPNVTAANKNVLLEIRRERRVELAFEGFRLDDLMRWKAGKLLEKRPEGIYFSGLGKFDLTGDGVPDIMLIPQTESIPDVKEKNSLGVDLRYYRVGVFGQDVSVFLASGNSGAIQVVQNVGSFVEPKYYYRPIPKSQTDLNPNLKQIFGWE